MRRGCARTFHVRPEPSDAPNRQARGIDDKSRVLVIEKLQSKLFHDGTTHKDDDQIMNFGQRLQISGSPHGLFNLVQQAPKNDSHFAIVLKGFDRTMASEEGFCTQAR